MFCPNCGKEIADGSYICPNCGATVEQQQEQQAQPAQPQYNQYAPQYQAQPQYNTAVSGKKNICATLGLVFGIIGAICAVVAFTIALVILYTLSGTVGLLYFMLALAWIALPFLLAGIGCSIGGIVMAKKHGHQGMAIAGMVVSIVFFIFWFFVI